MFPPLSSLYTDRQPAIYWLRDPQQIKYSLAGPGPQLRLAKYKYKYLLSYWLLTIYLIWSSGLSLSSSLISNCLLPLRTSILSSIDTWRFQIKLSNWVIVLFSDWVWQVVILPDWLTRPARQVSSSRLTVESPSSLLPACVGPGRGAAALLGGKLW